jgi:hypothetical protein
MEDWNGFGDDNVKELSKDTADKIEEKYKVELNLPRYKFIVQARIGQIKDEMARITSRCLLSDHSMDRHASSTRKLSELTRLGSYFGLWFMVYTLIRSFKKQEIRFEEQRNKSKAPPEDLLLCFYIYRLHS